MPRQGFPAGSHCETRHWIPINFISLARAYKFTCTRIKVITGRSSFIVSVLTNFLIVRKSIRAGWRYKASCGVHQLRLYSFVLFLNALTYFNLDLFIRMYTNLLGAESRTLLFTLDSQSHLLELVGGICATGGRELSG